MPELEVGWPDLNAKDEAPAVATGPAEPNATADAGDHAYVVVIEGLREIGDSEDLLKAFRQQSALEADRKKPANAAQIARRSRADAELLEQLLRSQGYYDADVEPRTEPAGAVVRVV
ncbi:MAG TPA: outer membrane protein assembly factor, partial [Sphingomicrobium sp.]